MLRKTILVLLFSTLPLAASAQSREKLADQYSAFAGSEANSQSLVNGLRNGTEVTLTNGSTTTTFTPPTGKMGNGNVHIALALAQTDLKQQGITNPTNEQLKTEMMKILQERADHKGWGQIAQSLGFKLGDVMRAEKADLHARNDRPERGEKPDRPERPERPDRAGRGPH